MRRIFLLFFVGFLVFAGLFVIRQKPQLLGAIWRVLPMAEPALTAEYQSDFRKGVITQANVYRGKAGVGQRLKEDPDIQEELARIVMGTESPENIELEDVFAKLREQYPETQALSATMVFDFRDAELTRVLSGWSDAQREDFEAMSVTLFNDGVRRGALAILTTRLPAFDLSEVGAQQKRFHRVCPLCGESHSIELDVSDRTLILKCPSCERSYDLISGGVDGRFRHANEFLEGFKFPLSAAARNNERVAMIEIWYRVLKECSYEHDRNENNVQFEAWKTSSQTWRDKAGDCEDTSILLCDALTSAGIESRVAVGRNVHIGDHAWCVARIGKQQFVLESTGDFQSGRKPVDVKDAANEYLPEQLFDRERIYFSDREGEYPCDDYWSELRWQRR